MKLAMQNPVGDVFQLTPELLEQGLAESRVSPRGRMLFPIHRHQDDLVQRMLNFMQPGTYVQPHQHPRDWATETIQVIRGVFGFVVFTETGDFVSSHRLEPGDLIDIEARVWHGVLALEPDTIILEIKRGPYDNTDKVFADWAPVEGADGSEEFHRELLSRF